MAKFVATLMRDYLLFAVSPTLLTLRGHEAGGEGASVAGGGGFLEASPGGGAAKWAAVELAAVASWAEDNDLITLRILALYEAPRDHAPPPASKKLDGRSGGMRGVRRRDACPATDRGPGGC